MTHDGSRLLGSLASCMGGWCEQRDNCAKHTTPSRSVPHERLCAKGSERPEPALNLTTYADPVCPVAVGALASRRHDFRARARAHVLPSTSKPMTPLAHDIKTLVQAAGFAGIRVKAIKAAFGCGVETASKHLRTLEAARLVERSRVTGQSVVWGPVGTWEHHESARAAAALVAFNKRNGAAQRADPDTDLEDGRPHAFVHRLVAAADCAPLRPTAPVSVFHVAGWAA